ncbi:DUF742 domain-containing protein [Streptomyces sp. NBC_01022]|uniref:DUF742 domain-containing protein n=1 Tax=Streptomyces sp. NBC_01022 TaxID=2903723 RepID=UPI002DD85934|nr:DUF742 domain-containing protein [Streptomyces sp. NBC_01022]WRZ79460.1 DUF742 domain-containing protein [Streptomyces sp. NBC_01022]WRZ86216.1 DUF742 domain-containing protein [Streptomyces sp. NBC_01022]
MSTHGRAAEDSMFVRTYTLTRGRTRPRHLLGLDTVLDAGPGRPGPGQAEECEEILALCQEHRRSVTELAGRLGRPVTAVKILVSDLLDADALVVPVTAPYASSDADARPSSQLLAALTAGLKRKWPDAIAYPQAG